MDNYFVVWHEQQYCLWLHQSKKLQKKQKLTSPPSMVKIPLGLLVAKSAAATSRSNALHARSPSPLSAAFQSEVKCNLFPLPYCSHERCPQYLNVYLPIVVKNSSHVTFKCSLQKHLLSSGSLACTYVAKI